MFTALAGAWHPACAAEAVECFAILPGSAQAGAADIGEDHAGDGFRSMARQHIAGGGDRQEAIAPAPHAGLWPRRVIIRHDIINHQPPLMERARGFNNARRLIQLRARRQKGSAILQRPAVILHMRHFQPRRIPGKRQVNQRLQVMEILPMHHGIKRERQARFTHQPRR